MPALGVVRSGQVVMRYADHDETYAEGDAYYAELEEDLSEAEWWADQARAAKLRAERDAVLDQVRAATGLHGRQRRTGSAGERARVAVHKAVARWLLDEP